MNRQANGPGGRPAHPTWSSGHAATLVWSPVRAFATFAVSATLIGGVALLAATAAILWIVAFNAGALVFQALLAAVKVLGPLLVAVLIVATGLAGLCRAVASPEGR